MANSLTGDFEAVFEVSVRQINGLLATLHQSGLRDDAPMPLLHSASVRIGDTRRPRPERADDFGEWVMTQQAARGPIGLKDLGTHLTANAPPGAATWIADLFTKFGELQLPPPPPPATVRGRARMQLSTLTISVPSGSTTEVTVHAFVRAHYTPDLSTTDLPKPIHGEVQATFEIRQTQSAAGRRLMIQPSADDNKIQFIAVPGTGLTAADAAKISSQVRKAVREGFPLLPVDLPASAGQTFPFSQFKGIGSGAGQAIALPLKLTAPGGPPVENIQSINNLFTGSSGFAFAISKEFVTGLIDIAPIHAAISSQRIRIGFSTPWGSVNLVTYRLRFSQGPTLTFRSGAIEVSGRIEVETGTFWAPNGWVTFNQAVTLDLNAPTQHVLLRRAGEPQVDEDWFIPHDKVVNIVRTEMDKAIAVSAPGVRTTFTDGRKQLVNALKSFDPSANAHYSAVEISPDGVIVRGDIDGAWRYQPIVDIRETDQGQAFTAFHSWIPGGRIEQLNWSWIEYANPSVFSGVTKFQTEMHRFVFPRPPAASGMCLRVAGTQTSAQGQVTSVVGGTWCDLPNIGEVFESPSWWDPVTVPIWQPDLAADVMLKDAIAGHVSVQADTPQKELTHNYLMYFADGREDKPLRVLADALGQLKRKDCSLMVIVVLPAGAFDQRRREFEARLGSIFERGRVQLTEDYDGGWTRTFAVAKLPSAYLMNARREFVWKDEGDVSAAELTGAIEKHMVLGAAPRVRPLRLAVSPGAPAPDILFGDDQGNHIRLCRLRGQSVLLNFWQPWSAPSLKELARLERLHKERQPPFVIALHGGKERSTLAAIRKQQGFSFVLAHDAEQRIARLYGVRCWPTTVSIDADGRIDHVQFGITHDHPKGKDAAT